LLLLLIGLVLGGAAGGDGWRDTSQLDGPVVRAVRFYRGDRTLVNGFVRVPYALLSGVSLGPGGFAALHVDVAVTDLEGRTLAQDQWARQVAWTAAQVPGAATVELLSFALAAGSYDLRVVVRDSASGRRQAVTLPITAFTTRPAASDLLLAYGIRRTTSGDTIARPGELRKGELFIASGPDLALAPSRAALFYYCEVYADSATRIPWSLRVVGGDGGVVVSTAVSEATFGPGGGSLTGALDLAGLPPGQYDLMLVIPTGADTVRRSAPFRMTGFEVERRLADAEALDAGEAFGDATEAELDTLVAPLVFLAAEEEMTVYRGLTVEGKRRWLREFWRRRDPTPGTPDNEVQTGFYQRIAEANRRFREGGAAAVPGWRTDRGRILLLYGEPDEVLRRPSSGPRGPWEAWKYSRGRLLKYVFLDRTRLGNYVLVYTDDRRERSFPDWESIMGDDAVQEIQQF
jgi:GWxTD domain-containing protein